MNDEIRILIREDKFFRITKQNKPHSDAGQQPFFSLIGIIG